MAVKRFKDFGRLSALVVVIAAFAAPMAVSAQEEGGRHGGRGFEARGDIGGGEEARPAPQPRGDGPSWRSDSRGEARVAPQARAVEAPSAPQVTSDGGGRRGGGWERPSAPTEAAAPEARRAEWGGRRGGGDDGARRGDSGGRRDGGWGGGSGVSSGGGWGSGRRERQPEAAPAPRAPERQVTTRSGGSWGSRDGTYGGDGHREGSYGGDRHREGEGYRDGRRDGDQSRWGSRDRAWSRGDSGRRDNNWQRDHQRDGYRDNHQRWDRDWRRDTRYNWDSYRRYNRSTFSLGIYYAPYRNYSYRRLSIGFFLDSLFLSDRYWLDQPYQYRLPEVYGPYRWVRYYDDVLLVDIYSGEVVDVIYDFFY